MNDIISVENWYIYKWLLWLLMQEKFAFFVYGTYCFFSFFSKRLSQRTKDKWCGLHTICISAYIKVPSLEKFLVACFAAMGFVVTNLKKTCFQNGVFQNEMFWIVHCRVFKVFYFSIWFRGQGNNKNKKCGKKII